jgi:hypothetical protein
MPSRGKQTPKKPRVAKCAKVESRCCRVQEEANLKERAALARTTSRPPPQYRTRSRLSDGSVRPVASAWGRLSPTIAPARPWTPSCGSPSPADAACLRSADHGVHRTGLHRPAAWRCPSPPVAWMGAPLSAPGALRALAAFPTGITADGRVSWCWLLAPSRRGWNALRPSAVSPAGRPTVWSTARTGMAVCFAPAMGSSPMAGLQGWGGGGDGLSGAVRLAHSLVSAPPHASATRLHQGNAALPVPRVAVLRAGQPASRQAEPRPCPQVPPPRWHCHSVRAAARPLEAAARPATKARKTSG